MAQPTQDEINEVLGACAEAFEEGTTQWPGMTYEQGVEAAIRWMRGDNDDNPMKD